MTLGSRSSGRCFRSSILLLKFIIFFTHLLFFFYPCLYGFFDGPGQVAFSPTESLYCLESEHFFQFIWEIHADSAHLIYSPSSFFARYALDFSPISKVPDTCAEYHFYSRHSLLHLAHQHYTLWAYLLI